MKIEIEYTSKIVFYSVATVLLLAVLQFLMVLTSQMSQFQKFNAEIMSNHETRVGNIETFIRESLAAAQSQLKGSPSTVEPKTNE